MGSRTDDVTARVLANPKYHQLVRKRNAISLVFFVVMLVIYAGFILTLAFVPELFARPSGAGFTTSIGVLTATLVAGSAVVMIAAYVQVSNKVFDPLIRAIVEDAT
ncbi:MAG: DUF485 domain-containing protein [Gammaproteobacteria bacterium]|nr:DUF485 domain-containing protein [Gammaproteobacteria bacterium]